MMIKRILFILSISVYSMSLMATEAKSELEANLNGLKSFEAAFEQSISSEQRGLQETSNGRFFLSRPGKFHWEYVAPYEQSIIADGEKIWVYDKDLDQVTVRNMQQALADSPALLLSETVSISDQFTVTKAIGDEQIAWFSLTPKSQENQYTSIQLGFKAGVIAQMVLMDAFGQKTQIVFTDQKQNKPIAEALFNFIPPEGVDVLDADATSE